MSFFRPEAVAAVKRWIEPVVLLSMAVLALWSGGERALNGDLFSLGLIAFGIFFLFSGIATTVKRLATGSGTGPGTGVVTTEEGRISYFGPETGGVVAIDSLLSVDIVRNETGPAAEYTWELRDEQGQCVVIPEGAVDAERMFDALGVLDGVSYQAVIDSKISGKPGRYSVWSRRQTPGFHGRNPRDGE